MGRLLTKPTKWVWAQRRLRSAWASARLIRVFAVHMKKPWALSYPLSALGGCPGWSESSLGAHLFCWFCHVVAHINFILFRTLSHQFSYPTSFEPQHDKTNKVTVRPAKTQISLGIRIWSESSLCAQWADAQADLSLRWAHTHSVGFVMSRLIYYTAKSW